MNNFSTEIRANRLHVVPDENIKAGIIFDGKGDYKAAITMIQNHLRPLYFNS